MNVYQVGRFFWHKIDLEPGSQRVVTCKTNEQHYPYRIGHSRAIRFWGHRGIVVGVWRGYHDTEEDALMAGMDAREDSITDENGGLAERFQRRAVRQKIADTYKDLDDEWTIVNALDLMSDEK